jgi:hypothetical protein
MPKESIVIFIIIVAPIGLWLLLYSPSIVIGLILLIPLVKAAALQR